MLLLIWPTSISSNRNWISQLAPCSEVTLGLTQHVASLDSCSEWNDPVGPWSTEALICLDTSLCFFRFHSKSGVRQLRRRIGEIKSMAIGTISNIIPPPLPPLQPNSSPEERFVKEVGYFSSSSIKEWWLAGTQLFLITIISALKSHVQRTPRPFGLEIARQRPAEWEAVVVIVESFLVDGLLQRAATRGNTHLNVAVCVWEYGFEFNLSVGAWRQNQIKVSLGWRQRVTLGMQSAKHFTPLWFRLNCLNTRWIPETWKESYGTQDIQLYDFVDLFCWAVMDGGPKLPQNHFFLLLLGTYLLKQPWTEIWKLWQDGCFVGVDCWKLI